MRTRLAILSGLLLPLFFPPAASAHAFGESFVLALPLWMYLYGAGIALIVSFLFIGYFMSQRDVHVFYPTLDVTRFALVRLLSGRPIRIFLRILSILLFYLTIVSGFIGSEIASLNFNMTFFWIVFYLGMTYLSFIFGDIFSVVSPWRILTEFFEGFTDIDAKGFRKYPPVLGYIPAVICFFCFIWLELLGEATPYMLSLTIVIYSFVTFAGVMLFGKKDWFKYGEFFSVYFGLISKGSLLIREQGSVLLRIPFLGLHKERPEHLSLLFFILFMLASTAFDGFRESGIWVSLFYDVLRPLNLLLGQGSYYIMQSVGLLLAPLLFFLLYFFSVFCMKVITRTRLSMHTLLLAFAHSLIPIAFVYNVAHYYTLLMVQGQAIIPLFSDPFGLGWNLFGTAWYMVKIDILGAQFIWNSQVYAIILGHVAGVYLSHVAALGLFKDHKKAILSQIPMLILMVCYTIIGLWILSQPII